ncbi:hypothetical protein KID03_01255 [bacterium]|nr:hypothetical protein [bacterium]
MTTDNGKKIHVKSYFRKDNTKVTSNEFTIKVADGGEIELPSAGTESVEEDAVVKDADILPAEDL